MAKRKQTYYELLGVKPDAKHHELGIAFNRKMRAMRREDVPPDIKAEARLKEAFDVLSDLERRAAYDAELIAAYIKPTLSRQEAFIAAGFIVVIAAGLYYYLRPAEPVEPGKPLHEIMQSASVSVGRLQRIDTAGVAAPIGVAFAIDEGRMVTSCSGITADAQLVVLLPPRSVPAHVATTDEARTVCQLSVSGAGSWPLSMSSVAARTGDVVYAVNVDAAGQVVPTKAKVRRVSKDAQFEVIDASVPVPAGGTGAPLLDLYGRVVGVAATLPDGSAHYVAPPGKWADIPPAPAAPAPEPAEPAPKSGEPKPAPPLPNSPVAISPERRDRLEKAFHPPPNIPDDL